VLRVTAADNDELRWAGGVGEGREDGVGETARGYADVFLIIGAEEVADLNGQQMGR
jgi:hypothetical protein